MLKHLIWYTMTKHISYECKCKFNRFNNSNQNWRKKRHCECRNYYKCKKDYRWNCNTCICENSKYLKGIADTSVTQCDEIYIAMDIVSTIASINSHHKKVRDSYILHIVLLVIILLLILIIICYYSHTNKNVLTHQH